MPKTLFAAAVVAMVTLAAAPAAHAKDALNVSGCSAIEGSEHPFTALGDDALYALSPGGDFESAAADWTLTGGAAVVDGDDDLGVRAGGAVLSLPAGGEAVSAPVCVDESFPFAKVLAQSVAPDGGTLDVDLMYTDTAGRSVVRNSATFRPKHGDWALSSELGLDRAKLDGAAPVQFRFTAPKSSGFLLDDLFVDPRLRA